MLDRAAAIEAIRPRLSVELYLTRQRVFNLGLRGALGEVVLLHSTRLARAFSIRNRISGRWVMADSLGARSELSPNDTTEIPDKDTSARLAQLDHLRAQGTLKYNVKDYDAAADFFSQATELQAEVNGEMASQNADLLYDYGRCLFHVAVANNDILGSRVAGEKRQNGSSRSRDKKMVRENGTASLPVGAISNLIC